MAKKGQEITALAPPVDLIADDERLEKKFGGSTFYYRRLAWPDAYLVNQELDKLPVDAPFRHERAMLMVGLTGWDNVRLAGVDAPFDKALINKLPFGVGYELAKALEADYAEGQEKKGPSAPS